MRSGDIALEVKGITVHLPSAPRGWRRPPAPAGLNTYWTNLNMSGLPAGCGDAFERPLSTKLCVRFTRGLRKVTGLFNRNACGHICSFGSLSGGYSSCRVPKLIANLELKNGLTDNDQIWCVFRDKGGVLCFTFPTPNPNYSQSVHEMIEH